MRDVMCTVLVMPRGASGRNPCPLLTHLPALQLLVGLPRVGDNGHGVGPVYGRRLERDGLLPYALWQASSPLSAG